jgi:23S rRNA (guanosine2251-2'-O)-methyltransferase
MAAPDEWDDNFRKPSPDRGRENRSGKPQGRPGQVNSGPRQGRPTGGDKPQERRPRPEAEPEKEPKNFIYGARTVMEAMEAGRQIDKILIKKGLDSELRNDVYEKARELRVPIQIVPPETLDRLARQLNHQGVIAYTAVVAYLNLEEILADLNTRGIAPLILMVDQVSDVRNFGGIARTAECMGVHAIVIPEQGSARINADAMKISAGALNYIPVCRVHHLQDTVHLLKDNGIRIAACAEKLETNLWEADLKGPLCLVFGSEEKGITPRIIRSSDVQVSIPMFGQISSLNVGVSVGVVLAEVARQRFIV